MLAFIIARFLPGDKHLTSCLQISVHEPYTTGKVTDHIASLLNPLCTIQAEVLILSYPELQPVSALAA
jgi:hypothetical protein